MLRFVERYATAYCAGGGLAIAKLRMSTARRNPDPRKQTTAEHDKTPTDENSKTLNKLARKEL